MRSILVSVMVLAALAACGGDDDGGGTIDAGEVPGGDGVICGDDTCTAGTEECCSDDGTSQCVAIDTCVGRGFACDGAEDCHGDEICCLLGDDGAHCRAPDDCEITLCNSGDDCADPAEGCCADTTLMCTPECAAP